MRNWYKYTLDPLRRGRVTVPIGSEYNPQSFGTDKGFSSQAEFFETHFHTPPGRDHQRLNETVVDYLAARLPRTGSILSVASGYCGLELMLSEVHGYRNIVCSDYMEYPAVSKLRELFPGFQWRRLDIVKERAESAIDCVVAVGLISLLNTDELTAFFQNVYASLKPRGRFFLDSCGAPDGPVDRLLFDHLLKYERVAKRCTLAVTTGHLPALVVRHHGYRRTNEDIVSAAEAAGLRIVGRDDFLPLSDFHRSAVLLRAMRHAKFLAAPVLSRLGRHIPQLRMFEFRRE